MLVEGEALLCVLSALCCDPHLFISASDCWRVHISVLIFVCAVTEDEVLYQNYQEKALHNDSDEDAESREAKPDDNIVVQSKLIRTSWSQLSVVR